MNLTKVLLLSFFLCASLEGTQRVCLQIANGSDSSSFAPGETTGKGVILNSILPPSPSFPLGQNNLEYDPLSFCKHTLSVGVGQKEITPPIGTPSAGYIAPERKMDGVHDPLLATAVVIDTGEKKIAICSVDHLGFDHRLIEEIKAKVAGIEVIVASSHTHSGTGGYLDIPLIGEMLAGPFNPKIKEMLVERTSQAILEGASQLQEAKVGIAYGHVQGLNHFRSSWPEGMTPPDDLAIIKFASKEGKTLALIYNYAVHPTTLSAKNTLYSADFVGYARDKIQKELGGTALFINGAQGDVGPQAPYGEDEYEKCQALGEALAESVLALSNEIALQSECTLSLLHYPYSFEVKPTSLGLKLPLSTYESELNVIVFNNSDAFVTVPGELSCLYVEPIQKQSPFPHTSIFGLVNDAHGYILTPEAFEHKTYESTLSFGGPDYGEWMVKQLLSMLQSQEIEKSK
jgi:hypothetical protein